MTLAGLIDAARVGKAETREDGTIEQTFRFERALAVFAGHFPGQPLLPGVFQIEMARRVASRAMRCSLEVAAIDQAKFLAPILPDETVRMRLTLSNTDGIVDVRAIWLVADQIVGRARLRLARAG